MTSKDVEARELSTQEQAVGTSTFDEVAKGLAQGTITRGRALRLVGAGLVSTILGSILGSGIAEAAPRCPSSGPGCNARCRNTGGFTCFCSKLTNGKTKCIVGTCEGRRCKKNNDCPSGAVCSQTAKKCCGEPRCVPLCTTSSSAAMATQSENTGRWGAAA